MAYGDVGAKGICRNEGRKMGGGWDIRGNGDAACWGMRGVARSGARGGN